ncbi:MAG: guanylate kinase [Lachnospiraceae bacterium]|nr:guanylate kinase [Lachnospiraceae bacterium]
MNSKGMLVVVSGFAGAGKGTLVKNLMTRHDGYLLSVSATSRAPREGEVDGVNYFFKTRDEFEKMIKEDAFIEYARYVDNYYGTPKAFVEEKMKEGKIVILEIEIQGALQIREKFPEAILLFIMPPSARILKERLVGRGTESAEVIEKRMNRASQEAEGIEKYDYIVVNDDVDHATHQMHNMIQSARYSPMRQSEFISRVRTELKNLEY